MGKWWASKSFEKALKSAEKRRKVKENHVSNPKETSTVTKWGVTVLVVLVVTLLHLIVGLGPLWPLVAAVAGAGTYMMVPAREKLKALEPDSDPAPLMPAANGERVRKAILDFENGPMKDIHNEDVFKTTWDLVDKAIWISSRWEELETYPEHSITVTAIVCDYLPDTIKKYQRFHDPEDPRAVSAAVSSLSSLDGELDRIKEAMIQKTLNDLEDQSHLLAITFGGGEFDVPDTEPKDKF